MESRVELLHMYICMLISIAHKKTFTRVHMHTRTHIYVSNHYTYICSYALVASTVCVGPSAIVVMVSLASMGNSLVTFVGETMASMGTTGDEVFCVLLSFEDEPPCLLWDKEDTMDALILLDDSSAAIGLGLADTTPSGEIGSSSLTGTLLEAESSFSEP